MLDDIINWLLSFARGFLLTLAVLLYLAALALTALACLVIAAHYFPGFPLSPK